MIAIAMILLTFGLAVAAVWSERGYIPIFGTYTGWRESPSLGPRPAWYFVARHRDTDWIRYEAGIPGRSFYWGVYTP